MWVDCPPVSSLETDPGLVHGDADDEGGGCSCGDEQEEEEE